MKDSFTTRLATNKDHHAVTALIDSVYREYNDKVRLYGFDKDLLNIEMNYFSLAGSFWVLENLKREILGTVAVLPSNHSSTKKTTKPYVCELKRLYLKPETRGKGLGIHLLNIILKWSKQNRFKKLELWTDSRFDRAQTFYSRLGFQDTSLERHVDDGNASYSEYYFYKNL